MTTQTIPSWILENVSLAKKTYYRIGGTARYFAVPQTIADVREAILFARENAVPLAFLGAGSNSLFSDEDFDGVILSFEALRCNHWETESVLYAEAGIENTTIAELCHKASRKGAAWMFRLPGQVGATVRMNARCYGGEVSQIVHEIVTVDLNGNLHIHCAKDVFLGYKDTSLMTSSEAVVAVRFLFPETEEKNTIASAMNNCENDRNAKHHFDAPSCGSTFKNNYEIGIPSGRIFDELGFRGTSVGGAKVSVHHANFIQNTGSATANDVLSLAAIMKQAALEKKHADLSLEVEPIGLFNSELCQKCGLAENSFSHSNTISSNTLWTGLAWHPSQKIKTVQTIQTTQEMQTTVFPIEVFAAPFLEYFQKPGAGEHRVTPRIVQLVSLSYAAQNPNEPFLRWETRVDNSLRSTIFPHMPQAKSGEFLNELWNYSVSEIFFEHPHLTEYDEYEMTPEQHWIAIAHEGRRIRKPGHNKPSATFFPNTQMWSNKNAFGMDFSYAQIQHLIQNNSIRVLCALSLGQQRYYLSPHWKDNRVEANSVWQDNIPPAVNADFHQPQRLWRISLLDV